MEKICSVSIDNERHSFIHYFSYFGFIYLFFGCLIEIDNSQDTCSVTFRGTPLILRGSPGNRGWGLLFFV